ncbi:NAD(P)-dependent alcohol dehydrogenase [Sphingobium lactosutens]|uniref:NAD(P)-dependent alcohol dehydrogenase n=1 Tax=Sphingobium lactosutens TaxID=522773 RepID=UPI0015BDFAF6|nr:NAD(P)-dependent alcohol dehydrogenase [Sphingobium lactosutens]NWK95979.1 NAD(P)-dependent alcohol dehydrogenase [Sphingobium lactosutens]
MVQIRAAVAVEKGAPLVFREFEIAEPEGNEILVKTIASGVCHTDLLLRDEMFGPALPAVPGHEGAGIVIAIGPTVQHIKVGDHVLSTQGFCGGCNSCRGAHPMNCEHYVQYNITGKRPNGKASFVGSEVSANYVGQSSFATHMLVTENNAVKLPNDLDLVLAAPLGCGLVTGSSTVFNVLKPRPGSSIIVFGAGAVGLAAVMAAKAAGCAGIVIVDLHKPRLEIAKEVGATHAFVANEVDIIKKCRELFAGGTDFGVDAVGLPTTAKSMLECLRPGGHAVLVGANGFGNTTDLELGTLIFNRTIQGAILGDQVPQITIPELVELSRQGRFPYEKLIRTYAFDDINQAIEDSETGKVIKPVITFN